MFALAVLLVAVGYATAYTGADRLRKKGAAPSLLYNLGISKDATPGPVLGASLGGDGATIVPATQPNPVGPTPIAPAMPVPNAGAQPRRYI